MTDTNFGLMCHVYSDGYASIVIVMSDRVEP
jgi:hypothetical protein